MENIWNSSSSLLGQIFAWRSLSSWQLWVFIYLVFAVGSSIRLSPSDVKGAFGGFLVILFLILIVNLVTVWAGNYVSDFASRIAGYFLIFYVVVFLIILINVFIATVILLILSILRINQSKSS